MRILISFAILVQLILAVGCNPYTKISKTPPASTRDSFNLANRCVTTFPLTTDTFFTAGTLQVDTVWSYAVLPAYITVPGHDTVHKVYVRDTLKVTRRVRDTVRLPADPFKIAQLELTTKLAGSRADSATAAMNKAIVANLKKTKYVWGFWLLVLGIFAATGTWAYMKFKVP
jgi:hypothetical protein